MTRLKPGGRARDKPFGRSARSRHYLALTSSACHCERWLPSALRGASGERGGPLPAGSLRYQRCRSLRVAPACARGRHRSFPQDGIKWVPEPRLQDVTLKA